ncbi:hypothetical protein [Vulcanisaeta thermophila]|uniref:hypothetical protein n=1 Tax=Vulcanisaeta thermophila TaxID=867917 RepID=UPI000853D92E|nr:hypothetical protein [Vulcanisaeta thermophila]
MQGVISKGRVAIAVVLASLIAYLIAATINPGLTPSIKYQEHHAPTPNELMNLAIEAEINSTARYETTQLPTTTHAYLIGNNETTRELALAGIPTNTLMAITINQLNQTPNQSIIIINWEYVRNELNKTVKILGDLFRKNDLIIIAINNSDFREYTEAEHALAMAWGRAYHTMVIGFPVINLTWASDVIMVAYGNNHSLTIEPLPISSQGVNMRITMPSLREAIEEWQDPTPYDTCGMLAPYNGTGTPPRLILQYGAWTYDQQNDIYRFSYCVEVVETIAGTGAGQYYLPTDYIGYVAYIPAASGGTIYPIKAGINMTTAYQEVDKPMGYNSYMGWAIGGIEPSSQSCIPQFTITIYWPPSLAITYQPPQGKETISNGVYNSFTIGTIGLGMSNVVWNFKYTNYYNLSFTSWCSGYQQTKANAVYQDGYGIFYDNGGWVLLGGTNAVNTAASPIYYSGGSVVWLNNPYTNTCELEVFYSQLYFILQYSPGSQWQVINLPNSPVGGYYNTILHLPSSECPG